MIQIIRKFSVSWVSKALLILLIGSFGIWGVTDFLRPKFRSDVVATVGKESITRVVFYQSLRNEMSRIRAQMGEDFDKNPQIMSVLASQVLENLVHESLLRQEIKKLHIFVSDETLKDIIQSESSFLDENGYFSKHKFDALLSHQGISEFHYLSMIRKDLQRRFLMKAVIQGIKIPKEILTPLKDQLREIRSVLVATISSDVFPILETPSDEELQEFYEANSQQFMLPEVRDLSVVILDPDAYQEKIKGSQATIGKEEVKEEALGKIYQAGKEIQDALASGSTLSEVAKSMNLPYGILQKVTFEGKGKDGILKLTKTGIFKEDMVKKAFELGEGNESDLTEMKDGRFYIVMVERIDPQEVPSFEAMREKVLEAYKNDLRKKLAFKKAKDLLKHIQKGESLEKIAQKNNLSLQSLNDVSLLNPPQGFSEEFLVELFAQAKGGTALQVLPKGVQIAQVQKISPNSMKDSKKLEESVEKFKEEFINDFLLQFMASLEEEFPVTLNTSVIKEMLQES